MSYIDVPVCIFVQKYVYFGLENNFILKNVEKKKMETDYFLGL